MRFAVSVSVSPAAEAPATVHRAAPAGAGQRVEAAALMVISPTRWPSKGCAAQMPGPGRINGTGAHVFGRAVPAVLANGSFARTGSPTPPTPLENCHRQGRSPRHQGGRRHVSKTQSTVRVLP